jgi:transcriptional regulator with XRE-family HTH domain
MAGRQKHFLSNRAARIGEQYNPSIAIQQFGTQNGATSYYQLAKLFGISDCTIKLIVETGKCSEHRIAKILADKMGLNGEDRKKFFFAAGSHDDKQHVAETLRDGTTDLSSAIRSLREMSGKSEKETYEIIGVPQSTFNGWIHGRMPSREYILKMAGADCFDLDASQQKIFIEAAGYYQKKSDILAALKQDKITMPNAVKSFMETEANSVKDYADKIGRNQAAVARWCSKGLAMPREDLEQMIRELPEDDQFYVLSRFDEHRRAMKMQSRASSSLESTRHR